MVILDLSMFVAELRLTPFDQSFQGRNHLGFFISNYDVL